MDATVHQPSAAPWSSPGRGKHARTVVLIVHGFTGNPVSTRPVGLHLAARGFGVDLPVLPGHGTDHHDLARTRYTDWYGCVDELVDRLREHADHLALIGHSMGGTLVLDVASRRPADVDAVVAINPLLYRPSGPLSRLAPVLERFVPYVPRQLAGMPVNDVALDGVEEHAYALVPSRAARSLLDELPRVRRQLVSLVAPLLVVRSPQDHTVAPSDALALLELTGSRDLRELVCEHSYHLPQLDVDSPRVLASVTSFLDEVTGS